MRASFKLLACVIAPALLAMASSAQAQKAGTITSFIGASNISPSVSSGNLTAPSLPGSTATVNDNAQLTGAIQYMATDTIGLYIPLGIGFKHQVIGTGAIAGAGKLADTKALPVSALVQYRFMPADAQWRPYIGGGMTYVKFYDTVGSATLTALTNPGGPATAISFKSKLVGTIQLGMAYNIDSKWSLDANVTKTFLKTRATLSTGQTLDMKLDPLGVTLGVGYRF